MRHFGGKTKKRVAKRRGNTRRNKRGGGAGYSSGMVQYPEEEHRRWQEQLNQSRNRRDAIDGMLHADRNMRYRIFELETTIQDRQFEHSTGLKTIVIPASVTSIGDHAFFSCEDLETVTFAENSQLTSIGASAFSNCRSLTTIVIPASVTSIGDHAFFSCENLETVTFAENSQLASIGASAFSNCHSLTAIVIPASVTSIEERAFFGCNALETVTFANHSKITNIHDDSFANCANLTTVEIMDKTIRWWNSHNPTAQITRGPNQNFLGHTVNIVTNADVFARRTALASVAQAGTNARLIEGAEFGPDAPRGVGLRYELDPNAPLIDPNVPRITPNDPRTRVQLPLEVGRYIDSFLGGKTKKRYKKSRK